MSQEAVKRLYTALRRQAGSDDALSEEVTRLGFDRVSRRSIADYRNGGSMPRLDVTLGLAARYGVTLDDILMDLRANPEPIQSMGSLTARLERLEALMIELAAAAGQSDVADRLTAGPWPMPRPDHREVRAS